MLRNKPSQKNHYHLTGTGAYLYQAPHVLEHPKPKGEHYLEPKTFVDDKA